MTQLYCIDTSSLLEAWVRRYPPAAFPALWSRLSDMVEAKTLIAPEEVRLEVEKRESDTLAQWLAERRPMFHATDVDLAQRVKGLLARHTKLVQAGKNKNLADPWVIALAQRTGAVVVTEEGRGKKDNPKIPDICAAEGIRVIKVVDLIVAAGWRF